MKILFRPLVAGALLMGALGAASPAHSQVETPAIPQVELQEQKAYELPIKNVTPHLIAWWLDPINQPRPSELGTPVTPEGWPVIVPQKTDLVFALPTGVESIAPLDAKKTLLVTGTEAGVQELRKIVAFLDQPIRQIEIETHVVALTQAEIKNMGLNFDERPVNPATPNEQRLHPSFSFYNGNLSTFLATRPQTGPRSEVKVPRTTVNNNLTAAFAASRSYPVPSEIQDKIAALVPPNGTNAPLELQHSLQFKLTPTINNDDTVTLLVNLTAQMQLGRKNDSTGLALTDPSTITSIVNAHDGQTVAIRGFDRNFTSAFQGDGISTNVPMLGDIPILGALFRDRNSELIVFLTPRIVRRAQP